MSVEHKDSPFIDTARNICMEWLNHLESAWADRRAEMVENHRNYNSILYKKYYAGRANIFVPMSFQMVETYLPTMVKGVFATMPHFDLQGVDLDEFFDGDSEITGALSRIKAYLHFEQQKKIHILRKSIDYFRNMCIFGRGYAKVFWRKETALRPLKTIERMEESDLLSAIAGGGKRIKGIRRDEAEITTYNGTDIMNVSPLHMWVDPAAPDSDIQRAACVVQRFEMTPAEIRAKTRQLGSDGKPLFELPPDFDEKLDGFATGKPTGNEAEQNIQATSSVRGDQQTSPNKRLEVHEFWLDYDIHSRGTPDKNSVLVMLDRKWIIRAQRNPFHHGQKPYLSTALFPRPNEFDANGLLDPTRRLQYELNDTRNQLMDYKTMAMNQMWWVGQAANYNMPSLLAAPNKLIKVQDVTQVRPVEMSNIQMLLAPGVEDRTERDMRNTSGALQPLQGVQQPSGSTASEALANLAQANARIELVIREVEEMFTIPMLEMQFDLAKQFLDRPARVRSIEPVREGVSRFGNRVEVSPFDLVGTLDFFALGSQRMSIEALKSRQLLDFFAIVSRMPPMPQTIGVLNGLLMKIWEETFGFPRKELETMLGSTGPLQPGQGSLVPDNQMGMGEQGIGGASTMPEVAQQNGVDNRLELMQQGAGGQF